MIKMKDRYNTS